ncbi:hypothetical protein [Deinococcus roseus]|uniref:hypothetical protein n=1 Tax=Deinococcus roseus TaxID=392414 RepID=UPI0016691ABA|nr:hypothetical protein [Deinococcus roseus]
MTALFPKTFREHYGAEICRDIQEMHREIQKEEGKWAANLYLMRAGSNVLQVALSEHWQQDMHMLRTQPATLIPAILLAGFTITGVLAFGQSMVNSGAENVGMLRWMNPGITTQEVTSEARYQPLKQAIEEVYHPSSIKILEFQRNQGGLKGGFWEHSRVLWVSVVSPQMVKEVRTSWVFPSVKEEIKVRFEQFWKLNSAERVQSFKVQMQGIVAALQVPGFDAQVFCAASPAVPATFMYQDQPEHIRQVKMHSMAGVDIYPAYDGEINPKMRHLYDAEARVWYTPHQQSSYALETADEEPCVEASHQIWDASGKLIW